MSLKNIILKSMATTMAVSIVFGNVAICGVGISEVIAEDQSAPEIAIEFEHDKYVQYKKDEVTSIAVHSKLNIYPNQVEENYVPTKKVEAQVQLPAINGYLPEKAMVVEARTKATTGEELNTNIDQNYDSNSGLLKMSYENIPNQDKQIYSQYNKQAKDEFEIIYSYPSEAYTGNEAEVKLPYQINAKMTFKADKNEITSQVNKKIEIVEKENKREIITFDIAKLENDIYKGFLYSNVQNKTNYDTEFKTVLALCVLNSNLMNELTMEAKESEFELNNEELIATNGKMNYQSTTISKYEFDRMLGQDGKIEIYQGKEVFATVQYVETKKEKKLMVIYLDGTMKEVDNNEIIIEYPENFTNLKIKTSKPVTEGYIHFKNQNIIKALSDYGCDVQKMNNIKITSMVNEFENVTSIPMLEPTTKLAVTLSNKNFSTLQTSKTTLTIKLDDTNASAKLFDNPTITVKLPEGLIGGRLSSPEIVNGNGLKIKKATAKDNIITIELEGKQTTYDLNNVSGGASIVMDIEGIAFSSTLPTHTDKIEITCKQKEEQVVEACDVNIVSKAGLLMLSEVNGYDAKNSVTTTVDSNIKKIDIANGEKAKEISQNIILVNNYQEDLSNLQVIGRLGYSNDSITSTFDTTLTKPITCNNQNAKIYYSEEKNASINDQTWKEEFSMSAKSYKIVLNNYLASTNNVVINVNTLIPEKLDYKQASYIKTEVSYTIDNQNKTDSSTIGMTTKFAESKATTSTILSTSLTTREEGLYNDTVEIKYNVNSMVEYYVKVKNNSNEKVNNVKVQYEIPEYLIYAEGGLGKYDEFDGYSIEEKGILNNNVFEYSIKELKAGEEKTIVIRCKVQAMKDNYEATVASIANVYLGNENYQTNINSIKISQAAYEVSLNADVKENDVLEKGDLVTYIAKVKNIGKRSGSFMLQDNIPEQIEVTKIEYYINEDNVTLLETSKQNIELTNSLEAGETLTFKITGTVKEITTENEEIKDIQNIMNLLVGETQLHSENVTVKIKTEKIEQNLNEDKPVVPGISEDTGEEVEKFPEEVYVPEDSSTSIIPGIEGEGNIKPDEPSDTDPDNPPTPTDPDVPDNPENPNTPENRKYTISGVAWLDANKNGQIENDEKLMDSVIVTLVNKETGKIVVDSNGKEITTTTGSNGEYKFENLNEGNYIAIFEFDTNTYTVTTYQKEGIDEKINSNAIMTKVTIRGNSKLAAITDNIQLNADKQNINIGLIENSVFDLSLDKQITKITVINSKGTEEYEYKNGDTAKVDLVAKYMNKANVIVNYRFTITNEGDITGYVDSLVDNLPSGLEFSSELNKDWYKGSDGRLYTTALSGIAIKPGESTQIELVLTKHMTEENTGVFPNDAELEKISNLENISEKENALENNKSSATLFISIKTGSATLYIGITLICTAIIVVGAYFIKNKVLNRGI